MPFMGRSRFDPRTLHGPWMEPSTTHEDFERHVSVLAQLPRLPQPLPAPYSFEGEGQEGAAALEERFPRTIFDDPADLARFANPHALIATVRRRGRPSNASIRGPYRSKEERAAAAVAAAADTERREVEAVFAAAARAAIAAAAEEAAASPLLPPPGLVLPSSQRKFEDLSGTVPAVLGALSRAGLEADKDMEGTLCRVLKRVDPEVTVRPRMEWGDKVGAHVKITPESATAVAAFLLKVCV
jgi:hypothetical protein